MKKSVADNMPSSVIVQVVIGGSTVAVKLLFSAADYYRMKRGELDVTWYCYRCLTLADPNQEDGITQVSEAFGAQRAEDPESESYPVNLEEGPDADTMYSC